jgi:histone-lysine N-methyltransferase SETMAR
MLSVTTLPLDHINPEGSKTIIHEAATDRLGYRKLCARWVPKMLTDDHKIKRMVRVLKFVTRYAQVDQFLDSIVIGDKTWVFRHTPELKQQSLQ